ncbi:conserved hypothetical Ustilaginaceae-specific protein [Sporisorium reilianum SRZ2]|uniref:Conserved hypothetical Ustilaginaceae-specific protein n=1 Tax=Sporisorium reilianum (strain SRZ2) TaxID=999809 RepID=E6ZS74_SPORE|nr:conserved hypothetical Ustilaginaceae-specific protein [Sporisorium reilianum SRZ2]
MPLSRSLIQVLLLLITAAALFLLRAAAVEDGENPFLDYHHDADFDHSSPSFSFHAVAEPSHQDHAVHPDSVRSAAGGSTFTLNFDAPHPFHPVARVDVPGDIPSSSRSGHIQMRPSRSPAPKQQIFVPPIEVEEIPDREEWHITRTLKYKLDRLRIPPGSLKMAFPQDDVRQIHLGLLQRQLQLQLKSKQVIPLGPTVNHDGRLFATPIQNQVLGATVIRMEPEQNVGWAIFSIRYRPNPTMTWQRYALLEVPNLGSFTGLLERHRRVGTLEDYLTRHG